MVRASSILRKEHRTNKVVADPLDDVDIDYSVDPEASAPSSPASPAKMTGNVRDSTAAELDSPAAAVKKRRTSITDETIS